MEGIATQTDNHSSKAKSFVCFLSSYHQAFSRGLNPFSCSNLFRPSVQSLFPSRQSAKKKLQRIGCQNDTVRDFTQPMVPGIAWMPGMVDIISFALGGITVEAW